MQVSVTGTSCIAVDGRNPLRTTQETLVSDDCKGNTHKQVVSTMVSFRGATWISIFHPQYQLEPHPVQVQATLFVRAR